MIRHVIFMGLLFSINQPVTYCQQLDYIRGKVFDSKTSEPVPFAALHLKNSKIGIYTNAEGDFRILNNPGFQSDSLIVSCIGFHRLSLAFSVLKTTGMSNLKIVPNIYVLNEVSVTARKKTQLGNYKPLQFQNNCFIQSLPLEQNCISPSDDSGRFWMNTPLKAMEKRQDSENMK